MVLANHVKYLKYLLQDIKKDPNLTVQQFNALEKAIMLAIVTFEQVKNNQFYNSATNVEEPMEID